MSAIVTEGLGKTYKAHVGKRKVRSLDALNLTIAEREVFGFLGRNGAGKTTTIKILCSLLKASQGRAFIFGEDVRTRQARRHVGYLPENPYFYEYLTPRETIGFYGRLAGQNADGRRRDWERLSELLDLGGIADQRVRGFSKGMRQRLGFAVALVGDPAVLILDEPMSGLDPLGRRMIRNAIMQMHGEGKTIFFSSHVLSDVEQICDRVGILAEGRLAAEGRIDDLLARRIAQVEIVATGLNGDTLPAPLESAFTRRSEDGVHLTAADKAQADALVQAVYAAGGGLFSVTPVRESLEEYFMRQQESPAREASA